MSKRYDKALTPEALAALSDEEIDLSDTPELDASFFETAEIRPARTKPNVSLRVDAETVAFFRAGDPKGYTARMAAVLEAYAAHQQAKTEGQ